jgi:hypothetical protein
LKNTLGKCTKPAWLFVPDGGGKRRTEVEILNEISFIFNFTF